MRRIPRVCVTYGWGDKAPSLTMAPISDVWINYWSYDMLPCTTQWVCKVEENSLPYLATHIRYLPPITPANICSKRRKPAWAVPLGYRGAPPLERGAHGLSRRFPRCGGATAASGTTPFFTEPKNGSTKKNNRRGNHGQLGGFLGV